MLLCPLLVKPFNISFDMTLIVFILFGSLIVPGDFIGQSYDDLRQRNDLQPMCLINEKIWVLIRWFFDRVTYIEVTEINYNDRSTHSQFAFYLINQLAISKVYLLNYL